MARIFDTSEVAEIYTKDLMLTPHGHQSFCDSHEALRELVKDLLAELRSKEGENSKELLERAQRAIQ